MMTANDGRDFYAQFGIEAIGLWQNTKKAIGKDWPHRPLTDLWCDVPPDANIGTRHGNGLINIDCDQNKNPATFDNIMRGLNGLGISKPPIVQTASVIGRGVYLRCNDIGDTTAYRNLSREVGAGELRFGIGSLSVLPDSQVNGTTYQLISGAWQTLSIVQWRDLLWLLPLRRDITSDESLPIRLLYRRLTNRINDLFDAVAQAAKGQAIGKYPSRSEAEAAIVAGMILNGWTFDQIQDEFARRDVGHYADSGRYADQYLETTYANILASIMADDIRQAVASEYQNAACTAWPGRTGNSDLAAYLAFLAQCYAAGSIETSVSVREIAEHAAMSTGTAYASMLRLISRYGFLERTHGANNDGTHASIYKLTGNIQNQTGITGMTPVQVWTPQPVQLWTSAELAARDVLGKSALLVYQHLDDHDDKSIRQLATATGKARSTVKRGLDRLSRYQLAIVTDSGGWLRGPNDLESVALGFDCEARAEARRNRHATQRERYRKMASIKSGS